MRLLASPNTIVPDVLLPLDEGRPDADRIKWRARVLTSAQRVEYRAALSAAYGMADGPGKDQAVNDVIRRCAVDWANVIGENDQPLPFNDDSLNLLTIETRLLIASQLPGEAGWKDAVAAKKP